MPSLETFFINKNQLEVEQLSSSYEELSRKFLPKKVDFEIPLTKPSWKEGIRKISHLAFSLIFFPYGLVRLSQWGLHTIAAETVCIASKASEEKRIYLDSLRASLPQMLGKGYFLKRLTLKVNNITLDGIMAGKKETIFNGRWNLHAIGNNQSMEETIVPTSKRNSEDTESNTLIINYHRVGRSRGTPSEENLGLSQEIGIQILEKVVKAEEISLSGFSLGAAAIMQAVKRHKFSEENLKKNRYVVITDGAFDNVPHAAKVIFTRALKPLRFLGALIGFTLFYSLKFSKFNLNNLTPSKKLQNLHLHEIIVERRYDEHGDGIIPKESSHTKDLLDKEITYNKTFITSKKQHHNHSLNPLTRLKIAKKVLGEFTKK